MLTRISTAKMDSLKKYIAISSEEFNHYIKCIDEETIRKAAELIIAAKRGRNLPTCHRYRQAGACCQLCGFAFFFHRNAGVLSAWYGSGSWLLWATGGRRRRYLYFQ